MSSTVSPDRLPPSHVNWTMAGAGSEGPAVTSNLAWKDDGAERREEEMVGTMNKCTANIMYINCSSCNTVSLLSLFQMTCTNTCITHLCTCNCRHEQFEKRQYTIMYSFRVIKT